MLLNETIYLDDEGCWMKHMKQLANQYENGITQSERHTNTNTDAHAPESKTTNDDDDEWDYASKCVLKL